MDTEKFMVKELVSKGYSVETKKVTICDLRNHVKKYNKWKPFQVHSDAAKEKFSEVYENLDEAIDKFFELKGLLKQS